ncbi:MAG: hypothetical protein D4S01_10150 [Dehalococcoidia bacterium]|nr:MAG: hypothetical protein D4S01_10150 [Dehalococcoidia bacterium]
MKIVDVKNMEAGKFYQAYFVTMNESSFGPMRNAIRFKFNSRCDTQGWELLDVNIFHNNCNSANAVTIPTRGLRYVYELNGKEVKDLVIEFI